MLTAVQELLTETLCFTTLKMTSPILEMKNEPELETRIRQRYANSGLRSLI